MALLVGWAGASVWLLVNQRAEVLGQFEERAQRFVEAVRQDIEEMTAVGREDVRFLAESEATRAVLGGSEDLGRLQQMFVTYAATHVGVFQVRLLDERGRERVRVESEQGEPRLVRQLQDKADRYYFQAAADLQPGQTYVSPIDLNVEHGTIERPLRPTIRFAAPVVAAGKTRGVVVINLEADLILAQLDRRRPEMPGALMLVDRQGVYVSHPDPARQWGGPDMLGTGEGVDREHPELATVLQAPERSVRQLDDAMVVVGSAPSAMPLPRVLLVAPTTAVVREELASFSAVGLVVGLSGVLCLGLVVVWQRQRSLADELAREASLRAKIAEREQTLREAQERLVASAGLAALSASAAALAHEVRNPLGAIVNSAGLLRREPGVDEDSAALMDIIISEGRRLERAVGRFVDLARRPTPRPEPVDVGSLIADVVSLARHDPSCGQDIELELSVEEDVPVIEADPDELRQVVWNLLRNAGTATRRAKGARVRIAVVRQPVGDAEGTAIVVDDEGEGPPASDDASKWPTRGTGVGLIVVAGVVARYGGTLTLTARDGGMGARATVVLPSARQARGPEKPWPSS